MKTDSSKQWKKEFIFQKIKEGLLVTFGSILALVSSFLFYYLLFLFFEQIIDREHSYHFVSFLRMGYGIVWMLIGIILLCSKLKNWMKACMVTGSLTTLMVTIGAEFYQTPIIPILIAIFLTILILFLLYKQKKQWYYYYCLGISILSFLLYTL